MYTLVENSRDVSETLKIWLDSLIRIKLSDNQEAELDTQIENLTKSITCKHHVLTESNELGFDANVINLMLKEREQEIQKKKEKNLELYQKYKGIMDELPTYITMHENGSLAFDGQAHSILARHINDKDVYCRYEGFLNNEELFDLILSNYEFVSCDYYPITDMREYSGSDEFGSKESCIQSFKENSYKYIDSFSFSTCDLPDTRGYGHSVEFLLRRISDSVSKPGEQGYSSELHQFNDVKSSKALIHNMHTGYFYFKYDGEANPKENPEKWITNIDALDEVKKYDGKKIFLFNDSHYELMLKLLLSSSLDVTIIDEKDVMASKLISQLDCSVHVNLQTSNFSNINFSLGKLIFGEFVEQVPDIRKFIKKPQIHDYSLQGMRSGVISKKLVHLYNIRDYKIPEMVSVVKSYKNFRAEAIHTKEVTLCDVDENFSVVKDKEENSQSSHFISFSKKD
ncbi:hypothetical protein ACXHQ0_20970 [Vibrio antiquarius]|uniref:Uncharacterized protein n=1 Tax=Vibrio parahaemolyticus TaxID=670 RepID=A0AA46Z4V0_VIBPH|nr:MULTISPECIES: hypothetical protein [Vibrio]KOE83624.1 hypothetical protein ACS91_20760 [Vibrio parahaemolyticus]MCS0311611.1 hypothetical protein [Vibrio diabolicus]MDW1929044.1 hypothetical protein [Vibrio sp. 947]UYV30071.1 hypothetical protein M5598_29220 [Vibrio parahaemolyticus]UYW18889.1 hypothetical protein IF561_27070 [Vibrio parahaemolyticus]